MSRIGLLIGTAGDPDILFLRVWSPRGDAPIASVEGVFRGLEAVTRREDVLAGLRSLLERVPELPRRLHVRMTPPVVQVRTLDGLPPVSPRDMVRLVSEQTERFFRPDVRDPVVSARRLQAGQGVSRALAALADPGLLDAVEALLAEAGARVASITAAADNAPDAPAVSLATPAMRRQVRHRVAMGIASALSIAVLGWLVPAGVYLFDLARDEKTLREELASVQGAVRQLESMEARLAEFVPVAEAFRRQSLTWAPEALAEIAATLPSELHLHGLRIARQGEITLEVHAGGASVSPDSLLAYWDGRAQIAGDPLSAEPFTIILEPGP